MPGTIALREKLAGSLAAALSRFSARAGVEAERQRLRDVLNQLPAYLVLLSPDYHVPLANRFFEERFGRSEGRRCYEYLFRRSEPCENCESFTPLKTDAPHRWEWTGPDGRAYDIYDFPFRDSNGARLVMEVGLDVTEVKQAQAALRRERQRLFDVLETLPAMICLLTKDYHVPFANRAFREKFGESRGRRCYEYSFGRAAPCEFCQTYSVLETGQPRHWEVEGPDGSVIDVHDFPFTDVDGTPLILEMDIDITARRKAQAALEELNASLERRVTERTAQLVAINEDLTRLNKAAVGRELRMIELKREVNELCGQAGQAPRYALDLEEKP